MSRILRTIVLALIIGAALAAAADASFVQGVDPRAGTFLLRGERIEIENAGGSPPSQTEPHIVQSTPPPPSPPVISPPAAVIPAATTSPAAAHERPADKRHHSRPSRDGSSQPGASAPAPVPAAGAGAGPLQAVATADPSVAGDDSSGPSLGLLIGAIATLGGIAILVLRLRPEWFIHGTPPAGEQGRPAAG